MIYSSWLEVESTKRHTCVKGRPSCGVASPFPSVRVAIVKSEEKRSFLDCPPLLLAGEGIFSVVAAAVIVILPTLTKNQGCDLCVLVAGDIESLLLSLLAVCFTSS